MNDFPDDNNPSDPTNPNKPINPNEQDGHDDPSTIRGTYQHKQLSARVPEHVCVGVFSTGAIILTTNTEFVIDFLIRMGRPHQIAARVILPPPVVPQIIKALRQAIERWQSRFGEMPVITAPPPERKPTLEEVYGELKLNDTLLSGTYANSVMISFSPAEFSFDFITNFFPTTAVSQRVYLSVPQVPRFRDALEQTFTDYQNRVRQAQQNTSEPTDFGADANADADADTNKSPDMNTDTDTGPGDGSDDSDFPNPSTDDRPQP